MKNILYLVVVLIVGTLFWSTLAYFMFDLTYLLSIKYAFLLTLFQFISIVAISTSVQAMSTNGNVLIGAILNELKKQESK